MENDVSLIKFFKLPENYQYDAEETDLISYGASPLISIEHISEIFKGVMFDEDNMETILRTICEENGRDDITILPSYTFPLTKNGLKPYSILKFKKVFEHFRKNINTKYMVALIGYDQEEVGHYNAFIWDLKEKNVIIFDSLFPSKEYLPYAKTIVRNLTPEFKLVIPSFTERLSLQYTGGNSENYPLYLSSHIAYMTEESIRRISLQSPESQNHFCYMWCIWFVHSYILGYDIVNLASYVWKKNLDPLTVIKSYGYNTLRYLSVLKKDKEIFPNIIRDNFLYYWDRVSKETFDDNPPFRIYEIVVPDSVNNINNCFDISINHIIF